MYVDDRSQASVYRHEPARKTPHVERLYAPAMPPLALIARFERWLARRRARRSLRVLLERDDHILCDLGFNRADLRRRLAQVGGVDREAA